MDLLPKNTMLGQLRLLEVYDEYDGPKFFLAENQFGQKFVAYWVDHVREGNLYGWLYMPTRDATLNKLRRGQISVRDAFKKAEAGVYLVYTAPDERNDSAAFKQINELAGKLLPPADVFVEPDEIVVSDVAEAKWLYEVGMKPLSGGGSPETLAVNEVVEAFRVVIESVMEGLLKKIQPKTFPLVATYGSFNVKFGANKEVEAVEALQRIAEILSADSSQTLKLCHKAGLEAHNLKAFLEVVRANRLLVTLSPKVYAERMSGDIQIRADQLDSRIRLLERSDMPVISSIKIPQANDLGKVIRAVELVADGVELTPEAFGEGEESIDSRRQVAYYSDAAFALGLLNRDRTLTSAGRFLLSKETDVERYQVLADRFESCEFGWGWIRWSGVRSMEQLDPETATDFVKDSVPSLGDDTARRRASTLRKWLTILRDYRRKYGK